MFYQVHGSAVKLPPPNYFAQTLHCICLSLPPRFLLPFSLCIFDLLSFPLCNFHSTKCCWIKFLTIPLPIFPTFTSGWHHSHVFFPLVPWFWLLYNELSLCYLPHKTCSWITYFMGFYCFLLSLILFWQQQYYLSLNKI